MIPSVAPTYAILRLHRTDRRLAVRRPQWDRRLHPVWRTSLGFFDMRGVTRPRRGPQAKARLDPSFPWPDRVLSWRTVETCWRGRPAERARCYAARRSPLAQSRVRSSCSPSTTAFSRDPLAIPRLLHRIGVPNLVSMSGGDELPLHPIKPAAQNGRAPGSMVRGCGWYANVLSIPRAL